MPDTDDRAANLLGALTLAAHDRLMAALSAAGGGSVSRAAALATLHGYPGDTVDELAVVLGITGSGATRLVAQLVRDGLVDKRAGRDGRSVALHLTPGGQAAAAGVLGARRASFGAALAVLSESDRRAFTALAERLLPHLGAGQEWADRTCRLCDYAACPQGSCPAACATGDAR